MKYILFFILFSSSSFAFDIFDPLDFRNAALVTNAGKTVGEMDLYLDHQKCAVEINLEKKTVSYFSYDRLEAPFRTVEFKEFSSNPVFKSLVWSKTWPLPLMHDRMVLYFDSANKLTRVVNYQYASWKPSHTSTCILKAE